MAAASALGAPADLVLLLLTLCCSCCVLLHRELPSLSKNFVMRMLFLDQPLPQAAVSLWVSKDSQK